MYEAVIPYHSKTVASNVVDGFAKFANIPVTPKQIATYLRKIAGRDTIISISRSDGVDPNTVNVSAYYDPDADEEGSRPIEVVLIFNPSDKEIIMDKSGWHEFADLLIDYFEHELIHQQQYRNRDFRRSKSYISKVKDPEIKKQQEYLGNSDEIDAYSYNLAKELVRKTSGYDNAIRMLKSISQTAITRDQAGRLLSPSLYGYFKSFNFDVRSPVLRSLLKKTYQNLQSHKKAENKKTRRAERNAEIEKQNEEFQKKQAALDKNKNTSYTTVIV